MLFSGFADFDPVDQAVHLVLDQVQTDIAVQFLFQVLNAFRGLLRLFFLGFRSLFFFLLCRRGRGIALLRRLGLRKLGQHIFGLQAPQILAEQLHALAQKPLHNFILHLDNFVLAVHVSFLPVFRLILFSTVKRGWLSRFYILSKTVFRKALIKCPLIVPRIALQIKAKTQRKRSFPRLVCIFIKQML